MGFLRYVAVGDSQTEGLNDGDDRAGYRGWADRLAESLAVRNPGLLYANLAVRGQRAGQIRAGQLPAALALEPDLVTVMAGMNDLVRPGFDVEAVTADLEAMFEAFTASGARVVAFTFPDIARIAPLVRHLRPRLLDFNERIRGAAARHGVLVVDAFAYEVTADARLWSTDRIHATPLGHARIAAAVAHALELPGSDASWSDALPPLPPPPPWRRAWTELSWAGTFLTPWLVRRLRGRSSGDGRVAKRPALLPVREA
ncbi:SGNH/GDSL hydrolase family protein [Planomonospora venezuelensis]|uniref:Lysophospholipase L1-like esterase n=1 Tax=Planomonospora venezuelensis TaxID=1999 RepID=A0A841D6N7_PLAVE|nr:SGNH/GDSL hydrolase family protein [Planomonospora venezuelensis]MBB5965550.1 lysophospholipase L1-like esterase [Planomonospora venezuelensis]GIN03021.1 lysophospholipase [Planomonospora venezuelensis]